VVERVTALQKDLGAADGSLAETALRFTVSHPAVTTVIPGMRTVRNVEKNAAASDSGSLDAATLGILKRHAWSKNFYG
jgi:aryl-alcohol dehydrogenase-like predicted oxidoreductase